MKRKGIQRLVVLLIILLLFCVLSLFFTHTLVVLIFLILVVWMLFEVFHYSRMRMVYGFLLALVLMNLVYVLLLFLEKDVQTLGIELCVGYGAAIFLVGMVRRRVKA
ncbi:hypothetical protein CMO92_04275 [Candidatus Woesearchaeota archaeon]|nr:hypothetical protein [Candidatus Woesearchaeota archaeon]|tara:strand:- start:1384 stop:1704 length:321 start_codon:yes stop_codon:yes gene_type:complete